MEPNESRPLMLFLCFMAIAAREDVSWTGVGVWFLILVVIELTCRVVNRIWKK